LEISSQNYKFDSLSLGSVSLAEMTSFDNTTPKCKYFSSCEFKQGFIGGKSIL